MWETWVRSLGQEDPLEKEMATHSSILVWRIPWTEEPGGLQSIGSHRVRHDWSDLACSLCLMTFSVQAEMYKIIIFKPMPLKMFPSFGFFFPHIWETSLVSCLRNRIPVNSLTGLLIYYCLHWSLYAKSHLSEHSELSVSLFMPLLPFLSLKHLS